MTVNEQVNRTTVCNGERFRLYLDESTIRDRVAELGRQISADYEGLRPVLVGVLNGAFIFLADLMREISGDCEVDFIKLSSYGESKISNGVVTELKAIDANLQGKHVLIIEDMVDTGLLVVIVEAQREPTATRISLLEERRRPLRLDASEERDEQDPRTHPSAHGTAPGCTGTGP